MLSFIKQKLRGAIQSKKINVFLLFVAVSFLILVLTKLSKIYTNTIAFSIAKTNVPEAFVVHTDSLHKLNITLKASGFELFKYYFTTPKVAIDMSTINRKNDSVLLWKRQNNYAHFNNQFNKDVEVVSVVPDSLSFKLDVNEIKLVPVVLNSKINLKSGYDIVDNYTLTPDSVKVIGPSKMLLTINYIQTLPLQLNDVKTDIDANIALQLPELNNDVKINTKRVNVKAKVNTFTEGVVNIPISVINVPKGLKINYFPKEVSVSYYTSLEQFKQVSANDFKVVCDYNNLVNEQTFLIAKLEQKSKFVKNAKLNQNRIEFVISK